MSSGGSPVSQSRVLLGLVLGAALGSLANNAVTEGGFAELKPALDWLVKYVAGPVGSVFLNLLFFAIVPLVFASLAVGVTRLGGTGNVGRIGAKTMAYFLVTTACAAAIGLAAVNLVKPGFRLPEAQRAELLANYPRTSETEIKPATFGVETFVNVVPRNPFKSFVEKDMLSIIFTAILVGIALTQIDPGRAQAIVTVLEGINQITEFVIGLAMRLAPIGVFALIFSTTALFGYELLIALGAFIGTVLGGLAIHLLIVLPLLVWSLGRMNPLHFFRKIMPTLVTAFGTSSSSATLPTAIKNAEEDLGVPKPIAHFVLPLSASMNHNGTALFESVTVLFLAQVFGVNLNLEQQIIVLVLSILTATGMAGVPGGSLPLIGMVLVTATNGAVPASAIAIILGVDRILDMCRTTVNVAADMTAALFIARTERGR